MEGPIIRVSGDIPNVSNCGAEKQRSPRRTLPLATIWCLFSSMTSEESQLAQALRERLKIISDETSRRNPDQHMTRLREISERIEYLITALPQPIAPRLAHFLDRKSYDKALEFLCSGSP
jgi:hypothetical protein